MENPSPNKYFIWIQVDDGWWCSESLDDVDDLNRIASPTTY